MQSVWLIEVVYGASILQASSGLRDLVWWLMPIEFHEGIFKNFVVPVTMTIKTYSVLFYLYCNSH